MLKIIKRRESLETCSEAGWFAYDYLLDGKIDKDFIFALRPRGSFVYLGMLKQPFFKIEADHFIIKGLQGTDYFRIAVHGDYLSELDRIEDFIHRIKSGGSG